MLFILEFKWTFSTKSKAVPICKTILYNFSKIRMRCAVPSTLHCYHLYSCFTVSLVFTCCFCVLLFFSLCTGHLFPLLCTLSTVCPSFKYLIFCIFCPYSQRCETRKNKIFILRNRSLLAVILQLFCSQFWHRATGQVKPVFSHKKVQWACAAPSLFGLDCLCCNSATQG